MIQTRGIRKLSENILAPQRALIVTEKDKNKYKWEDIPLGSKFIDTTTGVEMVKLEGQADWVPAGLKNDGTLNIAKDNIIKVESFTIEQETVSGRPNEFLYTNSEGQIRHGVKEWSIEIKDDNGNVVQRAGTLKGYIFQLEKGSYVMHRNHLSVTIDDVLHRSTDKGGIEEVSETKFRMTEQLENKMEITVEYVSSFRMGSPYPRFFMNGEEPEQSEVGDFWMDTDATLEEDGPLDGIEDNEKIGWDRIENTPDSLEGYGIKDELAPKQHIHNAKEIVGLPSHLPAAGGHADSADTAITATRAEKASRTDLASMAICDGANRNIVATYMTKDGQGAIGTWNIDIKGKAATADRAVNDSLGRNIINTYLTADGGRLNNPLNFGKGIWNLVGGEAYFGDIGRPGTFAIKGGSGDPAIALVSKNDSKDFATIGYNGSKIVVDKPIAGNITGNAASASSVDWNDIQNKPEAYPAAGGESAVSGMANSVNNESANMKFHYTGKTGQPTWLWGGNDAGNMYIYNPSNFNVKYATGAGNANTVDGHHVGTAANQVLLIQENGKIHPNNICGHKHNLSDINNLDTFPVKATPEPLAAEDNTLWISKNNLYAQVKKDGVWQGIKVGRSDTCEKADSAISADNALGLGGLDYETICRKFGGYLKPTVTPLMDWEAMKEATKAKPTSKPANIITVNAAYGTQRFQGATYRNGWPASSVKLKESYKNFDKILVIASNGELQYYSTWDVWELELAFSIGWRFSILRNANWVWYVYPSTVNGTKKHNASTDLLWMHNGHTAGVGIMEIYGIKY